MFSVTIDIFSEPCQSPPGFGQPGRSQPYRPAAEGSDGRKLARLGEARWRNTDVLNNRARLFAIPQLRDLLRDQHMAIAGAILERRPEDAREAAHAHLSYLRRTMRELSDAEARLDLSRRRRDGGGLTPPRA